MDPTTRPPVPVLTPPWKVRRTFPVEYHDVDALNHLNHAAYFRFMETLRCDYYLPLIREVDPRKLDPRTLDIIVAEASCRYLAPAYYGDQLIGEVTPAIPLGRTSFSLLYRFLHPDRSTVYARGRSVIVCFDYATNSKKPIPPARRAGLEADGVDPSSEGW
jgi:acyl-CoA thioester hydrolase